VERIGKDFFQKIGKVEKSLVVLMILSLVVVVISLFRGIVLDSQVQVEVIKESQTQKMIYVDVAGEVILPNVYELKNGSRLKDALVLAGGYTENADREYCEKVFNLAELLKDGQKIFIPSKKSTPGMGGYTEAKNESKVISINTATASELDTLWGIGEARIESIVKNRPYKTLEELVEKKVLTKQILEKNISKLSLY